MDDVTRAAPFSIHHFQQYPATENGRGIALQHQLRGQIIDTLDDLLDLFRRKHIFGEHRLELFLASVRRSNELPLIAKKQLVVFFRAGDGVPHA